jgi:hypothetical protein
MCCTAKLEAEKKIAGQKSLGHASGGHPIPCTLGCGATTTKLEHQQNQLGFYDFLLNSTYPTS